MSTVRSFIINRLYDLANVICIAADRLSPVDDAVWRQRRWDAYGVIARPDELGNLASEHNPTHTDYEPVCEHGTADD